LKKGLTSKNKKTLEYVGCDFNHLKKWFEFLFDKNMSWDNYGKYKCGEETSGWHIDHIIPCDSFNFNDETEAKACFYYLNLQPLWGKENILKSNNYNKQDKEDYIKKYNEIISNT